MTRASIDLATRLLQRYVQWRKSPIVLMYHSLTTDSRDSSRWSVLEGDFLAQMEFLREHGWTFFRVSDLAHHGPFPSRAVAITFDDGYVDNFCGGFEVLANRGICASWYLVSACLGRMSCWQDPASGPKAMLSGAQVREMHLAGMEIGAHSRHHIPLAGLSEQRLEDEIAGSKKELEDILQQPVTSFAYPYGVYDQTSIGAVRKCGFACSVTTNTGFVAKLPSLFEIPRVGIFREDSLSTFVRKLIVADTEVSWRSLAPKIARRFA